MFIFPERPWRPCQQHHPLRCMYACVSGCRLIVRMRVLRDVCEYECVFLLAYECVCPCVVIPKNWINAHEFQDKSQFATNAYNEINSKDTDSWHVFSCMRMHTRHSRITFTYTHMQIHTPGTLHYITMHHTQDQTELHLKTHRIAEERVYLQSFPRMHLTLDFFMICIAPSTLFPCRRTTRGTLGEPPHTCLCMRVSAYVRFRRRFFYI